MHNKILYIIQADTNVVKTIDGTFLVSSVPKLLQTIALENFYTIQAYRMAIKRIFNYKRYIPLCFNDRFYLLALNANNSIVYINYAYVIGVYGSKETTIVFQGGVTLKTEANISFIKKQFQKIAKIIEYKQSLIL